MAVLHAASGGNRIGRQRHRCDWSRKMLQVFRRIWCILSSDSRFKIWVLRLRPGLPYTTQCGSLASNAAPNPTTVIIGHRNPGFRTCTYEGTLVTSLPWENHVEVLHSAHPRICSLCPLRPVRDRRDRGMVCFRALAGRRLAGVQVRLRRGGRRHRSGPAIRRTSLRRRHDLRARRAAQGRRTALRAKKRCMVRSREKREYDRGISTHRTPLDTLTVTASSRLYASSLQRGRLYPRPVGAGVGSAPPS